MRVLCRAKLNLALDIIGLREDGYHRMDMVMQSISLSDLLTVTRTEGGGIRLSTDDPTLSAAKDNLAFRAAEAFFAYTDIRETGLRMHIKKTIPMQAGLGGGSADAAGVLQALRHLYKLPLTDEALSTIGLSLGADVPFCLSGGTAHVEGIGERIRPLRPLTEAYFVVSVPDIGSSTAEAFRLFDRSAGFDRPDMKAVLTAIENGEIRALGRQLKNVFEEAGVCPDAAEIVSAMREEGALGAALTGAGSAVFGLFDSRAAAADCFGALGNRWRSFLTRSVSEGVLFL